MTEENNHIMTLKRAIEEAYREGARSRDAEVQALRDALIECADALAYQVKYRYGIAPDERQTEEWREALRPVRNAHAVVSKSRGEA